MIRRLFEISLKEHMQERPVKRKPAISSVPQWQRQLQSAIREMEGYADEEVADLMPAEFDEAEDEDGSAAVPHGTVINLDTSAGR